MKPATALPWVSFRADTGRLPIVIEGSDGQTLARVVWSEHFDDPQDDCEANAAYIAHACNAYPKLVAALQLMAHTAISGMDGDASAACDDIQTQAQSLLRELGELIT